MTGDAVRWTYISTASGECNPSCRDSTHRSESRATSSTGVVRNSADHHSEQPHGNRYPSHKPQKQQLRLRHQRQLFFSFNKFLPLVLKLLSHCVTSTTRHYRSSSLAMSSPAATLSSFHWSGSHAGRNRRGFYTSLLVVFQVYAFSSSFVIASAHAATDDFSTSTREENVISSAENSAYDEFGDSDYNYGDGARFEGHYTPTWAVHIPGGDVGGKADQVARDHGFINFGKSISPGACDTEIFPTQVKEQVKQMMVMLRPEDVSDAIMYCLGTPPHVQIHELTIKPVGEKC